MQRVEILLATRNGAGHLAEQLASFSAQTHTNWGLRISDDGSTDATRAIAAAYRLPDGTTALLRNGPRAGSSAANFLSLLTAPDLPAATPVALSDQDDVWFPDRLHRGLRALAQYDGDRPVVFCSATLLADPHLRPIGPSRRHRVFGLHNALVQNVVAGNTTLLSPAAVGLLRRAGHVAVPFHDWWIYLLVTAAGGVIHYDPSPTAWYRQHGSNELGENRSLRARQRRARMVADGTWRGWVNANLSALRSMPDLLDPRWRNTLMAAGDLPARGRATQRLRWLATLRPRRQTMSETAALYAAILAGRI